MKFQTGRWKIQNRESGYTHWEDLYLAPELSCSSAIDEYLDLDGAGQLDEYVRYIQGRYPEMWDADEVPIYWSVRSEQGGVFETAPFQGPRWQRDDFLTHFVWPVDRNGERVDWFLLPVKNDRFPEFAKALAWTPSPLQQQVALRSLMASRAGHRV